MEKTRIVQVEGKMRNPVQIRIKGTILFYTDVAGIIHSVVLLEILNIMFIIMLYLLLFI